MDQSTQNPNHLLNRDEVESEYGIPKRFLERAGVDGPPVVRFGRYVRYRNSDVEAWIASHVHVRDTSEKQE